MSDAQAQTLELTPAQEKLVGKMRRARARGVPIIFVTTPDQFATTALLAREIKANGGGEDLPNFSWDIARGWRPWNEPAEKALGKIPQQERNKAKIDPAAAIQLAERFPPQSMAMIFNAPRYLQAASVMQSVANLRDPYKASRRTLVLMGMEAKGALPDELGLDVLVLREPLPDITQLERIVFKQIMQTQNRDWQPSDEMVKDAARRLRGVHAFGCEQLTALSLTKTGIDYEWLENSARELLEQTQGLIVEPAAETFKDIGGLTNAIEFAERYFAGPNRPATVVRIEELEKAMAGTKGDNSGVSQDALQVILSAMEDYSWTGILAYGPPGSGKSLFGKALASHFGVRGLRLDVNAARGHLVSQSELRIRRAIEVIHTIGGPNVFFVASINKLDLKPELLRRYRCGVWFFDLPGDEDKKRIWDIQLAEYERRGMDRTVAMPEGEPYDERDLSGADIRNICENAWALKCSLNEAKRYAVPLRIQSPDEIEECRRLAHNRFIDAARGGVYQQPGSEEGIDWGEDLNRATSIQD